jgi:hypothetical protein
MTDHTDPSETTTPPLAPAVLRPFTASLTGHTNSPEEWPNTVTVTTCQTYDPTPDHTTTDEHGDTVTDWADQHGTRQLIEIDTNYKPTRPGQHPVRLTRTDATQLATTVLRAIEDTFHHSRVGRLRPAEAAELLRTLEDLDHALVDLRGHALDDLLHGAGLDPDNPSTP